MKKIIVAVCAVAAMWGLLPSITMAASPTYSLTVTGCDIPAGASKCDIHATGKITAGIAPQLWVSDPYIPGTLNWRWALLNPNGSFDLTLTSFYPGPSSNFPTPWLYVSLIDDPDVTYEGVAVVKCVAGSSWNGSICYAPPPPPNTPPTASAVDKTITLPVSSVAMSGSGSDAEGPVTYKWTFVSGPGPTPVIVTPASPTSNITGMTTAGVYKFLLTVTDTGGLTATANATVTVLDAVNIPPTANAGADCAITLPTDYCNGQVGSGTDPDGTITSYRWTKISGPSATISSPNSATTNFIGMSTVGTYVFRLTVTDNDGATGWDEMTVTVSADNSPPGTPTGVTAVPGSCGTAKITISWTASPGATGYILKDSGTTIYTGTSLSYAHTGLVPGSSHSYTVIATKSGAPNSPESTADGAKAPNVCVSPPITPTGLTAVAGPCGTAQINVSWTGVFGATEYELYEGPVSIYKGGATSMTHSGLIPGSTHSYAVLARNPSGDSPISASKTAKAPLDCPSPPGPAPTPPPGPAPTPTPPPSPGEPSNLIPCGIEENPDKTVVKPCDFDLFIELIQNVINFLIFKIASPLAAVMFIYAGFLYVTNGGNEGKVKQAHDIFIYTFWGFVVCLAAWLTVNMILTFFLGDGSPFNYLK